MTKLQINAGQDHIAKYVSANPIITGITELIWNSLDANATTINIVTSDNGLNGFEYIDIIDDGHGCTYMQEMLFNILEILIKEIEIKQKTTKEVYMVVRVEDDIKL